MIFEVYARRLAYMLAMPALDALIRIDVYPEYGISGYIAQRCAYWTYGVAECTSVFGREPAYYSYYKKRGADSGDGSGDNGESWTGKQRFASLENWL